MPDQSSKGEGRKEYNGHHRDKYEGTGSARILQEGAWVGASDNIPVMYENIRWAAERNKQRQWRTSKIKLLCDYVKVKVEAY